MCKGVSTHAHAHQYTCRTISSGSFLLSQPPRARKHPMSHLNPRIVKPARSKTAVAASQTTSTTSNTANAAQKTAIPTAPTAGTVNQMKEVTPSKSDALMIARKKILERDKWKLELASNTFSKEDKRPQFHAYEQLTMHQDAGEHIFIAIEAPPSFGKSHFLRVFMMYASLHRQQQQTLAPSGVAADTDLEDAIAMGDNKDK